MKVRTHVEAVVGRGPGITVRFTTSSGLWAQTGRPVLSGMGCGGILEAVEQPGCAGSRPALKLLRQSLPAYQVAPRTIHEGMVLRWR